MVDLAAARERMVEQQIARRGVRDEAVLAAMRAVPREAFVPEGLAELAYDDGPLPIGAGQTISQPFIVAQMAEAAAIGPGDRVLDVGTGSGYAAAVMSRMAAEVCTIERHPELARSAEAAFRRLGYANIRVRVGDGTLGWPDAAPFEAIVVAAGGPEVPEALRRQLAVGGRLVMPVGSDRRLQTLRRISRTGDDAFEEDDLGAVAFVPLIGAQGWDGNGAEKAPGGGGPAALLRAAAEPLPAIDDPAFARLVDRFAGARVVLLGEATHGTSEFYRARARFTERLAAEHGFTVLAVEADWPDAARIDRYVRHRAAVSGEERAFTRFPTWMWRNAEVHDLIERLRTLNADREPGRRVGFYGLDLYSLNASIDAVLLYLDRVDPETARLARQRYGCLTPWQEDPATYGREALRTGFARCEQAVLATLRDLLDRRMEYAGRDGESFLDAAQNAKAVAGAERYYRVMYEGSRESWNLRDRHMFETLEAVLAARGPDAKAVVWAHNSHIGNAAATAMGWSGELNIGQLCRERWGDAAVLVGFGTNSGTVAAAHDWGDDMATMQVRPALPDSYERLSLETGMPRFLLDLRRASPALLAELRQPRLERAIGVVYRPETERWSHYFEAVLPDQFDAWIWFETTAAVTPLAPDAGHGMPDTYPFGL